MENHTIIIGNINCFNADYLQDIAGIAGMDGAFKYIDECTAIYTFTDELLEVCYTPWVDVQQMMGAFICHGFTVRIESE